MTRPIGEVALTGSASEFGGALPYGAFVAALVDYVRTIDARLLTARSGEPGTAMAGLIGLLWPLTLWIEGIRNPRSCNHRAHLAERSRLMMEISSAQGIERDRVPQRPQEAAGQPVPARTDPDACVHEFKSSTDFGEIKWKDADPHTSTGSSGTCRPVRDVASPRGTRTSTSGMTWPTSTLRGVADAPAWHRLYASPRASSRTIEKSREELPWPT
jgi:hypothetical protein